MSWTLLSVLVFVLAIGLLAAAVRRRELVRMADAVREREALVRAGAAEAQLQHPVVDLSRCLGCGTCVAACPEDNVLELVHGQAVVVNGARCQGIAACERECPVGAITVTLSRLEERRDVPVVTERLEAVGTPGLFLAGEVTAHALIKTAIEHGAAVAAEVAERVCAAAGGERDPWDGRGGQVLDLVVVGAGPAGLACSLEAKRRGLTFVTLDQETRPGGTVAKYPRRKLVVSEPVALPLHGRLDRDAYTKEELIELWQRIAAEQRLPLRGGEVFREVGRDADGNFAVHTETGVYLARHVCLALGRRGSPQKLGIPGEDLPHVAYSLLDAHSYRGRRALVVGGGDSAVEAALGLAEQPGNHVTLAYRRESFFRIGRRNRERLASAVASGRVDVLHRSRPLAIHADSVDLEVPASEVAAVHAAGGTATLASAPPRPNARTDARTTVRLAIDDVFVFAGGTPPFERLERSGVSFDPTLRDVPPPREEQGTGLVRALAIGFALSLATLLFALWHADYYLLPAHERPTHAKHRLLRPGLGLGLIFGIASAALIVANLLYLVRRSPRFRLRLGSLQLWMTSHVATGILALLCALLHGAMSPRDTVGGHAFWALAVLLMTGAVGRYFYAWVPRAANGRELEVDEVKAKLGGAPAADVADTAFHRHARVELLRLVERRQWRGGFAGRLVGLCGLRFDLWRVLRRLRAQATGAGLPRSAVRATLDLAREAHRKALLAAHLEDLRGLLATWRYLHRWVAALMVALVVVHVVFALAYGAHWGSP